MAKQPAVYMVANRFCGTIYTGVTSQLVQRSSEHRHGKKKGFSSRYDCHLLVWYELHEIMESAILREKQIEGGSRQKKITLIEIENSFWKDLYASLF